MTRNRCILIFAVFSAVVLHVFPAGAGTRSPSGFSCWGGIGIETLKYQESDPDLKVTSTARTVNTVMEISVEKQAGRLNFGLNGVAPVLVGTDTEKWRHGGTDIQSNRFQYAWYRVTGRIGYACTPWLVPYTGLKCAEIVQERTHFIVAAVPVSGSARETVVTYELPAGVSGAVHLRGRCTLFYDVCYTLPVYSTVRNSNFSGVTFRNINAHGFEAMLGIGYDLSAAWAIRCLGRWGISRRGASDWVDTGNGSIRYPRNKTTSRLISIIGQWRF